MSITDYSIKKFLRRGGALSISGDAPAIVRSYIERVVGKYLHDVSVITVYHKQKTISLDHFKTALEISNQALASSKSKKSKLKECKDAANVYKKISDKKRVEYQQKNTDCVIIPKETFKRYTKSVLQDIHFSTPEKMSSEFLLYFQIFIEYLVSDIALEAVKHAKYREGVSSAKDKFEVSAKDVNMAIAHGVGHI